MKAVTMMLRRKKSVTTVKFNKKKKPNKQMKQLQLCHVIFHSRTVLQFVVVKHFFIHTAASLLCNE